MAEPLDFEPFSPALRRDPYPAYRQLRDRAPVHWAPEAGCWCVSRHEDVFTVLNDPETFSSEAMFSLLMDGGRKGPPKLSWNVIRFVTKMVLLAGFRPSKFANPRTLISEDGERHTQTRRLVNRGFTPRRIAELEPRVRALADQYLAPLRAGEPFDLVRDFAIPLPVTMIAEMLGVEKERQADFKRWSDRIIEASTTIEGRRRREEVDPLFADVLVEMFGYTKRVARQRRKHPAGDLISAIVADHEGEAGLSEYDVVSFVLILLVAGNETTTNLIGNCLQALFDHPDQLEKLLAEPELVAPALEETLRYDAPVQVVFRTATRDVELHGTTIRAGDYVMPMIGSANRDERQWPDPDRFDIERRPQGHLGFGFGKHFCLGSSLARLEARCALEALLPEIPQLARQERPREWIDSFLVRGPAHLAVKRAA